VKQGQKIAAQVLLDLQGKGRVRKEAFRLTSAFGYFWRPKND
jgi:hypothetical protein